MNPRSKILQFHEKCNVKRMFFCCSSKEIQNTKAYIIQQVIYYAEGRRKLVQNKVAKVKGPGCPREGNIAVNKLLRVSFTMKKLARYWTNIAKVKIHF